MIMQTRHAPEVADHSLRIAMHAPEVADHSLGVAMHAPEVADHSLGVAQEGIRTKVVLRLFCGLREIKAFR